jgi:hypothetical protein
MKASRIVIVFLFMKVVVIAKPPAIEIAGEKLKSPEGD